MLIREKLSKRAILFMLAIAAGGCALSPEQRVAKIAHSNSAPLSITKFYPWMNSVGGISIELEFINPTKHVYKYIDISFSPRNAVGDIVGSTIGGKIIQETRSVGPFPFAGGTRQGGDQFGPLWYNSSIKCVVLEKVVLTRMDGSTEVFDFERSKQLVAGAKNVQCSH